MIIRTERRVLRGCLVSAGSTTETDQSEDKERLSHRVAIKFNLTAKRQLITSFLTCISYPLDRQNLAVRVFNGRAVADRIRRRAFL